MVLAVELPFLNELVALFLVSVGIDFRVQPDDRLVMVGLADRFAESADLFRAPAEL